ncbi:hypothetical protein KC327_g71 [Hortaea werneckii]|nr:hypothetical protein KC327_g71 [Hortaea werneckii]
MGIPIDCLDCSLAHEIGDAAVLGNRSGIAIARNMLLLPLLCSHRTSHRCRYEPLLIDIYLPKRLLRLAPFDTLPTVLGIPID